MKSGSAPPASGSGWASGCGAGPVAGPPVGARRRKRAGRSPPRRAWTRGGSSVCSCPKRIPASSRGRHDGSDAICTKRLAKSTNLWYYWTGESGLVIPPRRSLGVSRLGCPVSGEGRSAHCRQMARWDLVLTGFSHPAWQPATHRPGGPYNWAVEGGHRADDVVAVAGGLRYLGEWSARRALSKPTPRVPTPGVHRLVGTTSPSLRRGEVVAIWERPLQANPPRPATPATPAACRRARCTRALSSPWPAGRPGRPPGRQPGTVHPLALQQPDLVGVVDLDPQSASTRTKRQAGRRTGPDAGRPTRASPPPAAPLGESSWA